MSTFAILPIFRAQRNLLVAIAAGTMLLIALAATNVQSAHAEDLLVKYDQSQIVRLPRRAAEVIIGNPAIADVAISSGTMLVVTGKAFGITNVIVLDAEQKVITSPRIIISRPSAKVVNLTRGTGRQSYNCTPQCNTSLIIGDAAGYFNAVSSANKTKSKISENAIAVGSSSSE